MKKIYFLGLLTFLFAGTVQSQNVGTPDETFGESGVTRFTFAEGDMGFNVNGMYVQADNKILLAGAIATGCSQNFNFNGALVRLNPDGQIDYTYSETGYKLFPGGSFGDIVSQDGINFFVLSGTKLLKMDGNGNPDNSFGTAGAMEIGMTGNSMYMDPSGTMYFSGFKAVSGLNRVHVKKFTAAGTPDTSFGTDGTVIFMDLSGSSLARNIKMSSSGNLFVIGKYKVSTTERAFVVKMNAQGQPDTSFAETGTLLIAQGSESIAVDMIINADESLTTFGSGNLGDGSGLIMCKINPDGTLDNSFDTDGKLRIAVDGLSVPTQIFTLGSEKILVAGTGNNSFYAVVLNYDGTLEPSFGEGGKVVYDDFEYYTTCKAAALANDGSSIILGGNTIYWNCAQSKPEAVVMRYGVDPAFSLGTSEAVSDSFAVYPNPVHDVLNISTGHDATAQSIVIYDLSGRKVLERELTTPTLNVQHLPQGMYIAEVMQGAQVYRSKFVKQ